MSDTTATTLSEPWLGYIALGNRVYWRDPQDKRSGFYTITDLREMADETGDVDSVVGIASNGCRVDARVGDLSCADVETLFPIAGWRSEVHNGDTDIGYASWLFRQAWICGVPLPPDSPAPRVVVFVEGGLIQEVIANMEVDIMVVDRDVEGSSTTPFDIQGEPSLLMRWCAGGDDSDTNEDSNRIQSIFDAFLNADS